MEGLRQAPASVQERQSEALPSETGSGPRLAVGPLVVDFAARDAFIGGKPCGLTGKEFDVVAYLANHAGREVSRQELFNSVWGYDIGFNTNSLDVYIYRVRRKIDADGSRRLLQTKRGHGYRLVPDSTGES